MITVHQLMTRCWEHVIDRSSTVCIQAVRMKEDGTPEIYTKEVQAVRYDHKNRKLILK